MVKALVPRKPLTPDTAHTEHVSKQLLADWTHRPLHFLFYFFKALNAYRKLVHLSVLKRLKIFKNILKFSFKRAFWYCLFSEVDTEFRIVSHR